MKMQIQPTKPWHVTKPEELQSQMELFVREQIESRLPFHREYFQIHRMIHGDQDTTKYNYNTFMPLAHSGVKTPFRYNSQTNITRVAHEGLVSEIFSNKPDFDVQTTTGKSTVGKVQAALTEDILKFYYDHLDCEEIFRNAAETFTAYGYSAFKVSWKPNSRISYTPRFTIENNPQNHVENVATKFGITNVPKKTEDGGVGLVPEKDSFGKKIQDISLVGDVSLEALTPFEFARDTTNYDSNKAKWWHHYRILEPDDFFQEFQEQELKKTKFWERINPNMFANMSYGRTASQWMIRSMSLKMESGSERSGLYSNIRNDLQSKLFVTEHYDAPNPEKWPFGRRVISVNGIVVAVGEPQHRSNTADGWHPFVELRWTSVAPCIVGTSPLRDVVQKNLELNHLDKHINMGVSRNMGSFVVLRPQSGIEADEISGEPGQILMSNVADPISFVRDPQPLPPNVSQIREQKKEDAFLVSGAQEALQGKRSEGVSSGYAQKVIEEREKKRLSPVRNRFEKSIAKCGEKIISALRFNVTDDQNSAIGFLKNSSSGSYTEEDIVSFLNQDNEFNVKINVRAGSTIAKSRASRQAGLADMMKNGIVAQKLSTDGDMYDRVMKEMDVPELRDSNSYHRDRAEKENDIFWEIFEEGADSSIQIPKVLPEDDDEIHLASMAKFMIEKSQDLLKDETALQIYYFHKSMHELQMKEKKGTVPLGTTNNASQIYKEATSQPSRNVQDIQAAKEEVEQMGTPQAPKVPTESGVQTDPNAPSETNPVAPPPQTVATGGGM